VASSEKTSPMMPPTKVETAAMLIVSSNDG
jgi:hypothetical protein